MRPTRDKPAIIFIDSDRIVGDLLKLALQSAECGITHTSSVEDAERRISEHPPDLIIFNPALTGARRLFEKKPPEFLRRFIAWVDSDGVLGEIDLNGIRVVDRRQGLPGLTQAIHDCLGLDVLGKKNADRILLIDDDDDIRVLMSEFLRGRGYSVLQARNGREGVEIIGREEPLCVVLCDIMMPEMGGIECLSEIVKRKPRPEVVMMTSVADSQIAQQAIKMGAFSYILKPPDLGEVESTVSAAMSLFRKRREGGVIGRFRRMGY